MRIISKEPNIELDGLILPVYTSKGAYYVEPLIAFKDQLDAMLSHHSKVFVFRFDIRIKKNSYYDDEGNEHSTFTDDNQIITNYLKVFNRWLKRRYNLLRVGYVWCREIEKAKKQHYHLVLMVDGNKINATTSLHNTIKPKIKELAIRQGLVEHIPPNAYMVDNADLKKDDYTLYKDAFYRASYLAKVAGKNVKGERSNNFQSSRVKPRINEHGDIFKAGDDYHKRLK